MSGPFVNSVANSFQFVESDNAHGNLDLMFVGNSSFSNPDHADRIYTWVYSTGGEAEVSFDGDGPYAPADAGFTHIGTWNEDFNQVVGRVYWRDDMVDFGGNFNWSGTGGGNVAGLFEQYVLFGDQAARFDGEVFESVDRSAATGGPGPKTLSLNSGVVTSTFSGDTGLSLSAFSIFSIAGPALVGDKYVTWDGGGFSGVGNSGSFATEYSNPPATFNMYEYATLVGYNDGFFGTFTDATAPAPQDLWSGHNAQVWDEFDVATGRFAGDMRVGLARVLLTFTGEAVELDPEGGGAVYQRRHVTARALPYHVNTGLVRKI